jgi:hypothetical protein
MTVLGLSSLAMADKKAEKPAAAAPSGKAAAPAGGDKITGEVVDITCYASHEAKGEKHATCAAKCLEKGMPAGIVADGKLYVVTMKDHTAPGAKLAAWAGKQVTATGTKSERDGTPVFEIDTVAAAAK